MTPTVGAPAPSLSLVDDRGDRWSTDDFTDEGRAVVVILHRHFY